MCQHSTLWCQRSIRLFLRRHPGGRLPCVLVRSLEQFHDTGGAQTRINRKGSGGSGEDVGGSRVAIAVDSCSDM